MLNRLAETRKQVGMTQAELAIKSGVSRPYRSDIERGSQDVITNVVMGKLAMALNKKVEDVFFSGNVV